MNLIISEESNKYKYIFLFYLFLIKGIQSLMNMGFTREQSEQVILLIISNFINNNHYNNYYDNYY